MKRIALIFIVLMSVSVGAKAQPARVPAVREPIEVMQPDSTLLTVLLHGEEWKHWGKRIDGFVVEEDDKGVYGYVVVTIKGEQRVGCRVAHNPAARSQCAQNYVSKNGVKR